MTIIFDTETTGKPLNYKAPINDVKNWPRVCQLAWAVYDDQGVLASKQTRIIQPDGWVLSVEVTAIHGISQEQAIAEGVSAKTAINDFIADYEWCDTIVAHNIGFDYPVLVCEFLRYGMKASKRITNQVCTMNASTDFCKLPGPYGYKWPKLVELHEILFGEGFEGAHDALVDVEACGRCYFELLKRGIIKT